MNYTYDGTFEGLLTVVYERFRRKRFEGSTVRSEEGTLFQGEFIETDPEKSERVFERVVSVTGQVEMNKLLAGFLSETRGIEDVIFSYIEAAMRLKRSIGGIYYPWVEAIEKSSYRACREAHKFKGFVRFRRLVDDTYYAVIRPECNVIPLMGNHFIERFSDQNFVIHDRGRNIALVYSAQSRIGQIKRLTGVSEELLSYGESDLLHHEETGYIDLWRTFFQSVSIEGRKNPRCQRNFMPKKYWENLVEVNKG